MDSIESGILAKTGQRVFKIKKPAGSALDKAERIAGVRTRALRDPTSTIIDVCIIHLPYSVDEKSIRTKIADSISSESLVFDPSYGGTLVGLSFQEAYLTPFLFAALRKNSIMVHFKPYSLNNGDALFMIG